MKFLSKKGWGPLEIRFLLWPIFLIFLQIFLFKILTPVELLKPQGVWFYSVCLTLMLATFEVFFTTVIFGEKKEKELIKKALKTSEMKLNAFIENAYDPILMVNQNGQIAFVNSQLEKQFGFSRKELLGNSVECLIPLRYVDSHKSYRKKFNQSPHARPMGTSVELYAKKKDGSEFPVDVSLSAVKLGEEVLTTAIVRNISQQKKYLDGLKFLAETSNALNQTLNYQERLDRLVHSCVQKISDIAILVLVKGNQFVCKAIGAKDDTKINFLKKVISGKIQSPEEDSIISILTSSHASLFENAESLKFKKNREFDEKLNDFVTRFSMKSCLAVPLLVAEQWIGTLTLVSCDDKVFSLEDLHFAEVVASRGAILIENARLYLKANEAIKAREAILSIVSHDLRNPLFLVDMCVDRLLEETSDDHLKETAFTLKQSSSLMKRLISDLLDFGKIEAGALRVQKNAAVMQEILATALESMRLKAQGKGIQIVSKVSPSAVDPIVVQCDRDRIIQVLWNLIGNSIKFTPEHGVISLLMEVQGAQLKFSVTDTGPGIAEQDLPKVFERFWQAPETASLGTGLGLSIAKGIIEAHGGQMGVQSIFGKGCTFYFILPLFLGELISNRSFETTSSKKILGGFHVLVVDDSQDILSLVRYFLEKSGARVSVASSVCEGYALCCSKQPDIVLTDLDMQDGSGYDLMKKIRGLKKTIPIMALTGRSSEDALTEIKSSGFDGYLIKPVAPDGLVTSVFDLAKNCQRSFATIENNM